MANAVRRPPSKRAMSELANAETAADTKAPVIKRHRDLGPPNPISKRTRGAQLREAVDHTPKPSSSSQSTDHTPRTYVNYNPCMMKHLRASEERSRASPAFLAKQRDINEKMRSILVDWLVDVHLGFHLLSETLFLAVNLMDRYLDAVQVRRDRLQLVGCAAMFLAAKYEEICAPTVADFAFVTDYAYPTEEILLMEQHMLGTLGFQLTSPTAHVFLERLAKGSGLASSLQKPQTDSDCCLALGTDPVRRAKVDLLASFMLELALTKHVMSNYLPSMLAAAAFCLALNTIRDDQNEHSDISIPAWLVWERDFEDISSYTWEQLLPCMRDLGELQRLAAKDKLQSVNHKYAREKFGAVSNIQPWPYCIWANMDERQGAWVHPVCRR